MMDDKITRKSRKYKKALMEIKCVLGLSVGC